MTSGKTSRHSQHRLPKLPAAGLPMHPRDALNFYLEDEHTSANIMHALVIDGNEVISSREDAILFAQRILHLSPIFTHRLYRYPLDLHYPYWIEDTELSVADHVHVVRQSPGDIEFVRTHVLRQAEERFDISAAPPWYITFLVNVTSNLGIPDGSTVMIVKFHHCAIDGVGAAQLIRKMLSVTNSTSTPEGVGCWKAEPLAPLSESLRQLPSDLKQLVASTTHHIRTRTKKGDGPDSGLLDSVPATRFSGHRTPAPVWDVTWFDLQRIRDLKATWPQVSVNDIMTTVVSLTLSAYLERLGDLPSATLTTSMAISTRPARDSVTAGAITANQLTPVVVPLHTDVADPAVRLLRIHASVQAAKAKTSVASISKSPNPLLQLPSSVVPLLGSMVRRPPEHPRTAPVTTIMSNVDYGREPLSFYGATVVAYFGILPTVRGVHLAHAVRSIGSRLSLSVTSNRLVMPDIEQYTAGAEAAMTALEQSRTS